MVGCPYCGEMHSPLYICDEMRKSRAAVNSKPAVNTRAVDKRGVYPNTDARRAYMREKMRERRVWKRGVGD